MAQSSLSLLSPHWPAAPLGRAGQGWAHLSVQTGILEAIGSPQKLVDIQAASAFPG